MSCSRAREKERKGRYRRETKYMKGDNKTEKEEEKEEDEKNKLVDYSKGIEYLVTPLVTFSDVTSLMFFSSPLHHPSCFSHDYFATSAVVPSLCQRHSFS